MSTREFEGNLVPCNSTAPRMPAAAAEAQGDPGSAASAQLKPA